MTHLIPVPLISEHCISFVPVVYFICYSCTRVIMGAKMDREADRVLQMEMKLLDLRWYGPNRRNRE